MSIRIIVAMSDVKNLPQEITEVIATGRPDVPKGWVEQPGGIHQGHGIWMLRLKREAPTNDD